MSYLAGISPRGFISPRARVDHPGLRLGNHVYLGDGVIVYSTSGGGPIELADRVHLYGDTFVETGMGGSIRIGEGAHIQPGCHIHAYLSEISIGGKSEIAPGCAFYCYDHGMAPGIPVMDQPLQSKGGIRIGDGAWLGHGVIVLQGVSIGEHAVVAAGSVVTCDIPANAIAAGSPAKVLKFRGEAAKPSISIPTP
jgi:acetyltransferase-like isoleucine patch superfamily enzyme